MVWLGIADHSVDAGEFLTVNIFRTAFKDFPTNLIGAIAVLPGVRCQVHNNKTQGVVHKGTSFGFYKPDKVMTPLYLDVLKPITPFPLSQFLALAETTQMSVADVPKAASRRQNSPDRKIPSTSSGYRKMKKISELARDTVYFDLVAEVISTDEGRDLFSTIEVTDYTRNDMLAKRSVSPMSGMILNVNLWDSNKSVVNTLKAGDLVLIKNLKLKLFGTDQIEANLHGRAGDSQKVLKLTPQDPQVADLLERCEEYNAVVENSHQEELSQVPETTMDEEEQYETADEELHLETKPRVLAKLSDIKAVLDVPAKFCARVKFIDYFPRSLKDFVRYVDPNDENKTVSNAPSSDAKKVVRFALLARDETDQIPILFLGNDYKSIFPKELMDVNEGDLAEVRKLRHMDSLKERTREVAFYSFKDENGELRYRFLKVHDIV